MQLRVKASRVPRAWFPSHVRHATSGSQSRQAATSPDSTHYDPSTLPPEPSLSEVQGAMDFNAGRSAAQDTQTSRDAAMRTMDMMLKAKKNSFKHFYHKPGETVRPMIKVGDKGDEDWILDKRNPKMRYMEDNVGIGRGIFPRPRNDTFPKDYFTREYLPWVSRHLPNETEELAGIEDPNHPYYRWEKYIPKGYRNVLERYRPVDEKFESIITEHRVAYGGLVRRFMINRRWDLNAIDYRLANMLKCAFQQWDGIREANVFLLHTTSPGRIFCTGTDFRALAMAGKGHPLMHNFFREIHQLATVVESLKTNAMMILDGTVVGSGCIMALHAPTRLITSSSRMYLPDVGIGYFPDCGAVHRLSRLPHNLGTYILLSGCKLGPEDLLYLGIGSFYIRGGKSAIDWMQEVLGTDRCSGLERFSKAMALFVEVPINESRIPFVLADIDRCFGQATVKDIMTALGTIKEEWAAHALHFMRGACPFSLAVTFEYIKRAKTMTFHESIQMDYRLAVRMADRDDFFEGIRARIIELREPKWQYNGVAQVPKAKVDAMFEPFEDPARELKIIQSGNLIPKENYVADLKAQLAKDTFEIIFPPWMPDTNSLLTTKLPVKKPGEQVMKRVEIIKLSKKLHNRLTGLAEALEGKDATLSRRLDKLTPSSITQFVLKMRHAWDIRGDFIQSKIMQDISDLLTPVVAELTAIEEGEPPSAERLVPGLTEVTKRLEELEKSAEYQTPDEDEMEHEIAEKKLYYWRREDLTPHDRMSYWQNDQPLSDPLYHHFSDYGWRDPTEMPDHVVLKRSDI